MDYKYLLVEKDQGIMVVTINRPDKLNALTAEGFEELAVMSEDAAADDSVRAIVLTGAGRAFCAGADLSGLLGSGSGGGGTFGDVRETVRLGQRSVLNFRRIDKPFIAAVNGDAVGAGFGICLACDVRFASEKARFSMIFVRRGLVPDYGGSYFLPRLVGPSKALELIWTGELIDAEQALRLGIVNQVVPADNTVEAAIAFARGLAEGPTLAIRAAKRTVYQSLEMTIDAELDLEANNQAVCLVSEDAREGVAAFLEKRKPVFKGR
jgi:2-(1,2-epoxy-1,2-dihydrophenyl)acetyl-CoA isomerase